MDSSSFLSPKMTERSQVESLRGFVSDRLTAAAEEIFEVFQRTLVSYEDELDRQRRLLDVLLKPRVKLNRKEILPQHVSKEVHFDQQFCNQRSISSLDQPGLIHPHVNLHKTDTPQKHAFKEEENISDQLLCNQEENSSLDQDHSETLQMKEENEELFICQEEQQLELKAETESFASIFVSEENSFTEKGETSEGQLLAYSSVSEIQDPQSSMSGHPVSTADSKRTPVVQGLKPFPCEICGKKFKLKVRLKDHMTAHSGERPFPCSICGKRFLHRSHLKSHSQSHKKRKAISCEICGKFFTENYNLKIHMNTHTGEKPFYCSICGKRFTQRSTLTRHRQIHTGEKPFACKTCGKRFRLKGGLNVHLKTHSRENLHTCSTCGQGFVQRSDLCKHIQIHETETSVGMNTVADLSDFIMSDDWHVTGQNW